MNLFELLFLALAFTTIVFLAAALLLALSGRMAGSRRILQRLAGGAVIYFAIVIMVSLVAPRRVLNLGDAQCFDDWCISAVSSAKSPAAGGVAYLVNLRIASRARRASQRELNLAVYLTDEDNHRYDATPRPADTPLDSLLEPGQSIDVSRLFAVPLAARDVSLVIRHEGGFPIGWFIIGYDSWFQKPPLVRLSS